MTTRHKSNNNKERMGIAERKRGAKVHSSICVLYTIPIELVT